MSQKIVLASSNKGKLREFQQMLGSEMIEFVSQGTLGVSDAEETGLSFVENAIIKARHACAATGLPAMADDSGLEVDALQGQPGIYSARYAGPKASDEDNNQRLLAELEATGTTDRSARFQCVIVFMRHPFDPTPIICQGSWSGEILLAPRGNSGFGYDPLFLVPEQGCSSAELALASKNQLSHRGQALRQLLSLWPQIIPQLSSKSLSQ
ncbi:MAG: RdgB/HAM1 family non-canonical purine NTP pyrophosphatase [Pseudomonadales bacterium]|nr:RdgB/HAM1 family non-canonical purine NTP pyrophosphatase [Pseudomonadales bacterium]